jgi:hypothetical protein
MNDNTNNDIDDDIILTSCARRTNWLKVWSNGTPADYVYVCLFSFQYIPIAYLTSTRAVHLSQKRLKR